MVNYPDETKKVAVLESLTADTPDYMIAAHGGFSATSLQKWKAQLLGKDVVSEMKKHDKEDMPSDTSVLRE